MFGIGNGVGLQRLGGNSLPAPVGTIFDIDTSTLANLDDFSITKSGSTSIVLDGGYIKFSGIPAVGPVYPLTNRILFDNYVTGLSEWEFSFDYIVKSYGTAAEGVCIGFYSDPSLPFKRDDWYIHWRDSNDASFDGKVWATQQGTGANNAFATSTAVTNAIDDEYRLTLNYNNGVFTVTIQNLSESESVTGSVYTYTYSYPWSAADMSSSKMMIGHLAGECWVSNLKLTSTKLKNVDYLVLGDSMTMGYGTTALTDRWLDEVEAANPLLTFTKSACINDEASTCVNKSAEIALINAKKAILFIGFNEVVNNGFTTARNSFISLTALLNSNGISNENLIIINVPPYNGDADIDTFNTWLGSTYTTSDIIDVNTEFNNGSGFLSATYDAGDGVHPNDLGNTWISGEVNLLV